MVGRHRRTWCIDGVMAIWPTEVNGGPDTGCPQAYGSPVLANADEYTCCMRKWRNTEGPRRAFVPPLLFNHSVNFFEQEAEDVLQQKRSCCTNVAMVNVGQFCQWRGD